jgi:hypothetical protein
LLFAVEAKMCILGYGTMVDMSFHLRDALRRCEPCIETTLVGHQGDMRVRPKMVSGDSIPLGA